MNNNEENNLNVYNVMNKIGPIMVNKSTDDNNNLIQIAWKIVLANECVYVSPTLIP